MGAGIAEVTITKDVPVVLKDVTPAGLAVGETNIIKSIQTKVLTIDLRSLGCSLALHLPSLHLSVARAPPTPASGPPSSSTPFRRSRLRCGEGLVPGWGARHPDGGEAGAGGVVSEGCGVAVCR